MADLAASMAMYPICIQLLRESTISICAFGYFSKSIFFIRLALDTVPLISEEIKIPTIELPSLIIFSKGLYISSGDG